MTQFSGALTRRILNALLAAAATCAVFSPASLAQTVTSLFAMLPRISSAAPPALTATIETTVEAQNGTATTTYVNYYRDDLGRTRVADSSRATITDPATGVITLDLRKAIAFLSPKPPVGTSSSPSAAAPSLKAVTSNGKILKPYMDGQTDLGSTAMEGFTVRGERHSMEYPPGTGHGIHFTKVTTERWLSVDLGLPILTIVTNSATGRVTTSYIDIVANASIDPSVFSVPNGFQVVTVGGVAGTAAH